MNKDISLFRIFLLLSLQNCCLLVYICEKFNLKLAQIVTSITPTFEMNFHETEGIYFKRRENGCDPLDMDEILIQPYNQVGSNPFPPLLK